MKIKQNSYISVDSFLKSKIFYIISTTLGIFGGILYSSKFSNYGVAAIILAIIGLGIGLAFDYYDVAVKLRRINMENGATINLSGNR